MTYFDKDESCFLHKKDTIAESEEMNTCPHPGVQSNKEWWSQNSGKSVNSLKIMVWLNHHSNASHSNENMLTNPTAAAYTLKVAGTELK